MFFEWIGREGGAMLGWWVLSLLAGAAVYPLIFRLLGALPSRGYALARAAGLMLIGYVYWLLNNLGLLRNSPGSTVLAWLLVLGMSAFAYFAWRDREPLLPWLRRNLALIVTTEVLFAVMFFGWALVRALNPDLTGTEKPMEMAFLTSIRRSATFPPNDPWLSGYAISYYHFGYIMMGTLANLSGVTSGIAFNLSVSLLFGLTGVGGFGVAYDLVASRARGTAPNETSTENEAENVPLRPGRRSQALTAGVLAAVMLLVMGNLGAGMEMAYNTRNTSPAFLSWMDLRYRPADLSGCAPSGNADPASWGCGWWFWAYSRLVNDRDLAGTSYEIITEVPQFSFILSDMHPHVLSLPFAMLVLGLGLSLVLGRRRLHPWEFLIYAIFTGGMVFLNSWDAVFLIILLGAEALRRLIANGTGGYTPQDWLGMVGFGAGLVALTAVLYLPFFIGFRSQVAGIVPNVIWPTQFQQFFIIFGTFLVILAVFLYMEVRRAGESLNWRFAGQVVLTVGGVGLVTFAVLALLAWGNPQLQDMAYKVIDESGGLAGVIPSVLVKRLQGLLTEGLLIVAIFVVIARLFARVPTNPDGTPRPARQIITYSPATGYVLLLIGIGAVLTLAPDFVYLRDGFGYRINTVFKLYYQTWLVWGIASAYAVWSIFFEEREEVAGGVPDVASQAWQRGLAFLLVGAFLMVLTTTLGNVRGAGSAGLIAMVPGVFNLALSLFSWLQTGWLTPKRRRRKEAEAPTARLESALSRIRPAFGAVAWLFVALGLIFPWAGITTRAFRDGGHLNDLNKSLTLDGGPSLALGADDYSVIQCLNALAKGDRDVVAEAARNSVAYDNSYGRVAALTGIPTLIGWDNHERQWRGETFDQFNVYSDPASGRSETRVQAITRIYNAADWQEALPVIKRYGITFVYVGPTERRDFPDGLAKFAGLKPVCSSGNAAAYSVESIGEQTTPPRGG